MKARLFMPVATAVLVLSALEAIQVDDALAADPVTCAELAVDPANGLAGNASVKSASSRIIPATKPGAKSAPNPFMQAAGPTVAHCQVDILYGTNAEQNINIRIGLPLNSTDGGSGGVEGAWNGRTQGTGGGGCSGSLNVTGPVNAGYVGSGNDTGHSGGDCEPGVNPDGSYNLQFINDFIRDGMKQQILFSKTVAARYYGREPAYNYWNGCSTGGRQGYILAQELGAELDGIFANAPAMYWTRFQTAQLWGQVVMKELVGGPIASAKLAQVTTSAVEACDADDGVTDGVIDDPRTCMFSAKKNVCGEPAAPASNCLTPKEAEAIDRIWDGPRNRDGNKIWFGLDRGTDLGVGFGLNSATPFMLGITQFHWDEHNRDFDWSKVTMDGYAKVAENGSRNIADVTDTFGNLDEFKQSGGKLLTYVGTNDQLIMPRGVIHYYRQMASHYDDGKPDFEGLQSFYRLFRAPGVGHCGGGAGPQPQGAFEALVDWVENGKAPDSILAQTRTRDGEVTRSRPLCPYPQTAIYNGSGSTDDADNFKCSGNLETPEVVCRDVLVKYKEEAGGPLDYSGTGVSASVCSK